MLMVLARAWRRRLYGSLGMMVVVPVALLASLTILALNGGVPGLGSLREALSGPSAPAVAAPGLGGLSTGSRAGLPQGSHSAAIVPGPSSGLTGSGATGGSHGTARPGGSSGVGRTGSGGGGGGSVGGGGGAHSGSPQPSSGQPSRSPTAVDRVIRTVTPVTSSLPSPAGALVTRTLRSGGSLADRVLHQLPVQ